MTQNPPNFKRIDAEKPKAKTQTVLYNGDCRDYMRDMPDNYFDAVVTDPPYGLNKKPDITAVLKAWMAGEDYHATGKGFMNKSWDSSVPGPSIWNEVFRVLKPGGHALVFAGTRTQHLMGIALELAGFEVRECFMWIFGSGFPKSLDVGKAIDKAAGVERDVVGPSIHHSPGRKATNTLRAMNALYRGEDDGKYITAPATKAAQLWDGYGSAVKPAYEPILLARKPLDGTIAGNCLEWGCGGLDIDGCRIEIESESDTIHAKNPHTQNKGKDGGWCTSGGNGSGYEVPKGRFPANIILDDSEEVRGLFPDTKSGRDKTKKPTPSSSGWTGNGICSPESNYGDSGSAARFFYCAKASPGERNLGLENMQDREGQTWGQGIGHSSGSDIAKKNIHSTVKPLSLIRYLTRLVNMPGGSRIFDPFMGSGTGGMAAILENAAEYHGCEKDTEEGYFPIAQARIQWAKDNPGYNPDKNQAKNRKPPRQSSTPATAETAKPPKKKAPRRKKPPKDTKQLTLF